MTDEEMIQYAEFYKQVYPSKNLKPDKQLKMQLNKADEMSLASSNFLSGGSEENDLCEGDKVKIGTGGFYGVISKIEKAHAVVTHVRYHRQKKEFESVKNTVERLDDLKQVDEFPPNSLASMAEWIGESVLGGSNE